MEKIEVVKAYYQALNSADFTQAEQYLDENYQLVDFLLHPMSKTALAEMNHSLKKAMPNLNFSLSNIRVENNLVKSTVQLSGNNSNHLDLRNMGIGVIPRSNKFIIFPNGNYEFTIHEDKITLQRDVSAVSPNRRFSGMLKALGVDIAALKGTYIA